MAEMRQAMRGDLEECARLFVEVFAEPPYEEQWQPEEAVSYLDRFLSFDPENCWVAVADDAVRGMLLGYHYPWRSRSEYYIREILVHPSWRGKGIGSGLIAQAVSRLGGDAAISLVANEKTRAHEFYEKLGIAQHPYYKFYSGRVRTG
jgi:aminoglycoside 6'-N-acetyltransferase I